MRLVKGIIALIPLFLIAAVIVGGIFIFNKSKLQSPSENNKKIYQESQNLDRAEIFTKLTKNSWGCSETRPGSPGPDYTKYSFKADGTYTFNHITDYPIPAVTGNWNFEKSENGDWFLLYSDGQRLRFGFSGKNLVVEKANLPACNDTLKVDNPYTESTLPKIKVSEKVTSVSDALTSTIWKRANDFDLDYEPTSVELKKNWEYVSTWRNGECQNNGNWSLTDKDIRGSSLTDKCDPRDDSYPESFRANFIDKDHLILNYDLYVSEKTQLKKGVIWSVFGYHDTVNINVEYDMPIKVGVPNRFNVKMTNVAKEKYIGDITLQRFSVTKDFVRNYRQPDKTITEVEELGGIDLKSKILKPGETYEFSLDVTFDSPGKQKMYINAMMYEDSQSWDTHQLYSITVN